MHTHADSSFEVDNHVIFILDLVLCHGHRIYSVPTLHRGTDSLSWYCLSHQAI